jgi:Domain of unknown function (DUF4193)
LAAGTDSTRERDNRDAPGKSASGASCCAIIALLAPPRGLEGARRPYPQRRNVTEVSGTNCGVCAFVLRHDPYDSGVGIMATDYDAPRRSEADELVEDSLDELKARRNEAQSGSVDVDESESAENFELPGADLSGEELIVRVLPKQADEFTCSSCFLVHHRSRLAEQRNGRMVCRDCAA